MNNEKQKITYERTVQNEVIKFFNKELGFSYIGNFEDKENENINIDSLRKYLEEKMHYSKKVTDEAIVYLFRIANSSNKDLYDTNKKVYE